jgi:hypothetical protein
MHQWSVQNHRLEYSASIQHEDLSDSSRSAATVREQRAIVWQYSFFWKVVLKNTVPTIGLHTSQEVRY